MNKIIVRIKGGLGNQLFCYAAARRLALVNDAELVIDDVTGFVRDYQYQRKYMLDRFQIPARKATPRELMEPFSRYRRGMAKIIAKRRPFRERSYLEQEGIAFDSRLLDFKVNGTVYLDGYWQSELYFKDVEDVVRQDLRIMPHEDAFNHEIAQGIRNSESVCVHFRFYDNPTCNNNETDIHSNLEKSYYDGAVKEIIKRVIKPHFFLFSDNLQEARNMLKLPEGDVTIINHDTSDGDGFLDFWLMTLCKHFIIANSTFSWWSAWLSQSIEKNILAPQTWFLNENLANDIVPCAWGRF